MKKINGDVLRCMLTADWHLSCENPASRKDDFAEACLKKLKQLKEICKVGEVDLVIAPGDIWHKHRQTFEYVNKVMAVLQQFPCPVFVIVGNHDVQWTRTDLVHKSPLGLLIRSKCLKLLKQEDFYLKDSELHVHLKGFDYEHEFKFPKVETAEKRVNFAVCHGFLGQEMMTWEGGKDFLDKGSLENSGWDILLAGHDHVEYPDTEVHGCKVFRPGALTRGTKHVYNRVREVIVKVIDIGVDGIEVNRVPLKVERPDKVYSLEKIEREDAMKEIKSFVQSLEGKGLESGSTRQALEEVCTEEPVKELILSYCRECGVTL